MGKLDKPIILDGVDDLIIVQTEDARLIMRRGQSQKVRGVLNTLSCLTKSCKVLQTEKRVQGHGSQPLFKAEVLLGDADGVRRLVPFSI